MEILVNGMDVGEVLSCYGLLVLDFLIDRSIVRCRFVQRQIAELCADGNLRSTIFEFEHSDFLGFLSKCAEITARKEGERVVLSRMGKDLITLDWFNFPFVGDAGNFSKTDKLQLVELHLSIFRELSQKHPEARNLFASCKYDDEATNYLVLHRRNYLDAGGVYEPVSRFFARELFLIVGLQNFRNLIDECLSTKHLDYNLTNDWMPVSAAFAALVTEHPRSDWSQFTSRLTNFGEKGRTLKLAQQR
jgi:hypothetical protein